MYHKQAAQGFPIRNSSQLQSSSRVSVFNDYWPKLYATWARNTSISSLKAIRLPLNAYNCLWTEACLTFFKILTQNQSSAYSSRLLEAAKSSTYVPTIMCVSWRDNWIEETCKEDYRHQSSHHSTFNSNMMRKWICTRLPKSGSHLLTFSRLPNLGSHSRFGKLRKLPKFPCLVFVWYFNYIIIIIETHKSLLLFIRQICFVWQCTLIMTYPYLKT